MLKILNINNLSNKKIIILIFLIFLPLFMFYLGVPSFWNLDEIFHAEVPREMLLRHDFVGTYFNYDVLFDKPPLTYWVNIISYKLFGISEFSARFGTSIFSLLILVLVYLFGNKLFSKRVGFLSALILGSSLFYFAFSQTVLTDQYLIFFISLSLYWFYLGYVEQRKVFLILMGLPLGLGILAKGPLILLLTGLIIISFSFFYKKDKKNINLSIVFNYHLWLGLLLSLIISAPWYIAIISEYKMAFIESHFRFHMLKRFSTIIENHSGPWYYYIIVFFSYFLPWSWSIISSLILAWRNRLNHKFCFLLVWVIVIFVFFSLATTKLISYILPLMPPMAILMAYWWNKLILDKWRNLNWFWINVSQLFFLLFFLLLSFGVLSENDWLNSFNNYKENPVFYFIYFTVTLFFLVSLLFNNIIILILKKYKKDYLYLFVITFVSFYILISVSWVSFSIVSNNFKPDKFLSQEINKRLSDDDLIVSRIHGAKAIVFYLQYPVLFIHDDHLLKDILISDKRAFIILYESSIDYLNKHNIPYYLLSEKGIGHLISNYK